MSNSIIITLPHRLGSDEAKRRIAEGLELLRRDYIDKLAYSEANWNGDTANLRVVAFGQSDGTTLRHERCLAHRSAASLDPCRLDRQDPRRSQDQSGGIAADRAYPVKDLNGVENGNGVRANLLGASFICGPP